jgi:hypothetical protein
VVDARRRSARPWLAIVLGVTISLSACGGGSSGDSATASTLDEQVGLEGDAILEHQTRAETLIRGCMKAQGFDYVPVDPVAQQAALVGTRNLSEDEFNQQFGYGITTLYGRASAQTDPNDKIREGLSEADRAAYDRALSGGNPDQTFVLAVDTGDFSQLGGCTKQATDRAFGGARLLQALQRKLDELDDSIAADQRMVHAQDAWRKCVEAATGEQFEDAESIEDQITQRFERLVGSVVPPGQIAPEGTQVDMSALRKLQQDEMDLFRKDRDCERKLIDPVETKVRQEKETKFKSDNAELLSKVKPLGT